MNRWIYVQALCALLPGAQTSEIPPNGTLGPMALGARIRSMDALSVRSVTHIHTGLCQALSR